MSQHPVLRTVLPSVFDISDLYTIRYHFFHEDKEKNAVDLIFKKKEICCQYHHLSQSKSTI